tara:strand:+ start:418443 stop:419015 length:573 start_codon:yes stop_codon:yes gene_type:complete
MKLYEAKQFNLPTIEGLSEKQIEVHLKLYEGYVKHTNLIREQIKELKEKGAPQYVIDELRRRYAFEFDGMRMHEYYFEQFEEGAKEATGDFKDAVSEKYGSFEDFISHIKEVAGSRGIGWIVVSHDDKEGQIHTTFAADHELGHLAGTKVLCAIDMWEHAFMVDYVPAEKGNYLETVLQNINWEVVGNRY